MLKIDGELFARMVRGGAKLLEVNKNMVNMLNVFPVPDGDTGTNMLLTVSTAAKEVESLDTDDISELASAFSKGALKGARGNSGVILSQIFKGFSVAAENKEALEVEDLAHAFVKGTEIAYSAVTRPKEGTILTVMRIMAERAAQLTSKKRKAPDIEGFFDEVLKAGEEILAKTPDMLPVLKKAGVVDAGGKGLLFIFRGFYEIILGNEIPDAPQSAEEAAHDDDPFTAFTDADDHEDIHFGYCTEYFITNLLAKITTADIDRLRDYLSTIGDCVLVIGDLQLVKVHVHTNKPDKALNAALKLGEIDRVKIENMLEQNRQILARRAEQEKAKEPPKPLGMISICSGEGMKNIFKDLMVDVVVEGGQTMNPSVDDILTAVNEVNADSVIVLPNNKNIILAAEQAKDLANKKVVVIPTVNCPQGIGAALAFNPEADADANASAMAAAIDRIRCGQVTHAVRATRINGFSLKEGDIIGLDDKKVIAKGDDKGEVVKKTVEKLITDDVEVVTLYYGEGVEEEEALKVVEELTEQFPGVDVMAYEGGQPHYYYLISLE